MRVLLNGRELTERIEELEQREKQYFEIISIAKKAIIYILGAIVIVYLFGLPHTYTYYLPIGFKDVFDGFSQTR